MDPSWGLYIGCSKAKGSPNCTGVTYAEKNAMNAFCCCWAAVCALCQDREKPINALRQNAGSPLDSAEFLSHWGRAEPCHKKHKTDLPQDSAARHPPGMHPGSALPLPALSKGRGNRCQPACAAEPAQLLASGWQSSFGSFPCRDTPGHGADVLLHRLPNPTTNDAASVQGVKPEQGSSARALRDRFGICCLGQPSMYIADL